MGPLAAIARGEVDNAREQTRRALADLAQQMAIANHRLNAGQPPDNAQRLATAAAEAAAWARAWAELATTASHGERRPSNPDRCKVCTRRQCDTRECRCPCHPDNYSRSLGGAR